MASVTENSNQLNLTDRDILLSILPSNVWVHTSKILEEKHPSTLESLSNSSLFFGNLILSKRHLFLLPQVFELIVPRLANQKNPKTQDSNIANCRLVSKSWNKAVDQFIIGDTLNPDFFNTKPSQPRGHLFVNAKYLYFGHMEPTKLSRFLAHFQQTHLPQSSRNPFIGRVVYIDLLGFRDQTQWASIADQVSTLLWKYGHQIRILNLGLFNYQAEPSIQLQNHLWLSEWLENCPNLTHLKISERFDWNDESNTDFGRRPDHMPREERSHSNWKVAIEKFKNRTRILEHFHRLAADRDRAIEQSFNDLERLDAHDNLHGHSVPNHIQQHPIPPFPTLKKLQCLKLVEVLALNFNSLISANTHVEWLHIEPLNVDKHRYVDYFALEFPNLRKVYLKFCSPEEVRKLKNIHQSWLSLTHLHFEYCTSEKCSFDHEFMEWGEIFRLISENWGTTLKNLRLMLLQAKSDEEEANVVRDLGHFQLYLPKLKRLAIRLRIGLQYIKEEQIFLNSLGEQVEQLIIE